MPENQTERSRERRKKAVPIVLLLASLLTLTISTRSLEGLPKRFGLSFLGFFQRGFSAVGDFVSNTASAASELRALRKDYDALQKKLESYTNLERGNAELIEENARLKAQLGFSAQIGYERIPATIVAKDPENNYATLVINKGIEDGVRKNMPVVAFQNGVQGLVGRVLEVGHGTSIVVPLYDASSYIASRLASSRYEGLVSGQGGRDDPLVMKFVKKRAKDEIQYGDLVVTSGYESIYPPDIAVARVSKVKALDYQTSLDVELEPVLDFSKLEYVFVIKANALLPAAPAQEGMEPAASSGGKAATSSPSGDRQGGSGQ
jgi:rod shape-determining protein MreC